MVAQVTAAGPAKPRRTLAVFVGLLLALAVVAAPPLPAGAATTPASAHPVTRSAGAGAARSVRVVVQGTAAGAADAAVRKAGGTVTAALPIVSGVAAEVPVDRLAAVSAAPGVLAVTPDERVRVATEGDDGSTAPRPVVLRETRSDDLHMVGVDGRGVRVALVDTGVTPVPDLAERLVPVADPFDPARTAACVDLSGEASCSDSYGHGTFIAGLIAGSGAASAGWYRGVAPGADIVSIKIAGRDGSADVSKVLAAIQWTIWAKDLYGIRVLNLSLGTNSPMSYRHDPLDYAVERAWDAGIVVVVAASNRGPDPATISKPGDDPLVITVGAVDDRGSPWRSDDSLPLFSGRGPTAGDGLAKPDLVAPGARVVSLRSPGSTIEGAAPGGIDATYRRGSGTSMATGVVSGVTALLLQARPAWTPDRVKFALMATAHQVADSDPLAVGAGLVDAQDALAAPPGLANEGVVRAGPGGSLEDSRGNVRVLETPCTAGLPGSVPSCVVAGEGGTGGSIWDPTTWNGSSWYGSSWYGSSWYGSSWYGVQDDTSYGTTTAGSSWYGAWQ